jgi:hypothetical protein
MLLIDLPGAKPIWQDKKPAIIELNDHPCSYRFVSGIIDEDDAPGSPVLPVGIDHQGFGCS